MTEEQEEKTRTLQVSDKVAGADHRHWSVLEVKGDRVLCRPHMKGKDEWLEAGSVSVEAYLAQKEWEERDAVKVEFADALGLVHGFLTDYVVFSSPHEAVAVSLWVAHTYLMDSFETTPRLAVRSPEKQTGKTRLLECLEMLSKDAVLAAGISVSSLFRLIDTRHPTILQDEADTVFTGKKDYEELRAAYNSGYRRGASIWRVVDFKNPTPFDIFTPVALAGIGDLPDTIMDRSVVVNMRRKTADEKVRPFRARWARPRGTEIAKALVAWAASGVGAWLEEPEVPEGVSDRQCDVWEPLLAIADMAQGDWPEMAREAMVDMTLAQAGDDEESSLRLTLLRDLRRVWPGSKWAETADLILLLQDLDEAPWGSTEFGKPVLDPMKMAKMLKDYRIKPRPFFVGTRKSVDGRRQVRGYSRDDLVDVWDRYLGPEAVG